MKQLRAALLGLLFTAGTAAAVESPASPPTSPVVRRLSADQYRNIIHDVFGGSIELGGHLAPDLRLEGLSAVGAAKVSITPQDMEQYDAMARSIAAQVVDAKHRGQMIGCRPAAATAPDDACATAFLAKVGLLLYRRPLSAAELQAHVTAAHGATQAVGDFYQGLSLSFAAMLSSPQFLFREPAVAPVRGHPGQFTLSAYSKASQLSFFLWDSGPDLVLLDAAAHGDLDTPKGLAKQVDRMMASPRLEAGVRAFFSDIFAFDGAVVPKDTTLFPKFSAQVRADAEEQTLRTLVDLLVVRKGDYRDIFTTKKTFLTPELATIYRVPVASDAPNGAPDTWKAFEFPDGDPRAGILTEVAFTAFNSPPGRGSPTLRGKALRETILCQKVPAPPGDVKFNLVNDTTNPLYKTARKRLTAHRDNAVCAGCHKIMDPIGLALEDFDGAGEFRSKENGETIDTSGELDGVAFTDATGLAKAVHDNPAAASCVVNRLSAYASGHAPGAGDQGWIAGLNQDFAGHGYRFFDLMRAIAVSDALYHIGSGV